MPVEMVNDLIKRMTEILEQKLREEESARSQAYMRARFAREWALREDRITQELEHLELVEKQEEEGVKELHEWTDEESRPPSQCEEYDFGSNFGSDSDDGGYCLGDDEGPIRSCNTVTTKEKGENLKSLVDHVTDSLMTEVLQTAREPLGLQRNNEEERLNETCHRAAHRERRVMDASMADGSWMYDYSSSEDEDEEEVSEEEEESAMEEENLHGDDQEGLHGDDPEDLYEENIEDLYEGDAEEPCESEEGSPNNSEGEQDADIRSIEEIFRRMRKADPELADFFCEQGPATRQLDWYAYRHNYPSVSEEERRRYEAFEREFPEETARMKPWAEILAKTMEAFNNRGCASEEEWGRMLKKEKSYCKISPVKMNLSKGI